MGAREREMLKMPDDVSEFMDSYDLAYNDEGVSTGLIMRRLFEVSYGSVETHPVTRGSLGNSTIRKPEATQADVFSALLAAGYRHLWADGTQACMEEHLFVAPATGMIRYSERHEQHGGNAVDLGYWGWVCLQPEVAKIEELIRSLHDAFEKPDIPFAPTLYALVVDGMDLEIAEVGEVGCPLRRQNYEPAVCELYDRVAAEIQRDEPSGRLVLIDGPPGVGKTYLIRALVQDCQDCKFVVVMPNALERLTDPTFLPTMMRECRRSNRHLVLVVEDADALVRARDGQTEASALNQVASLLNMSEGLLGHALDLRIIATTNQESVQMDKAVTRDGRLLERIHVGELSAATASKCLQSLRPGVGLRQDCSPHPALSEVYAMARAFGWRPDGDEKGPSLADGSQVP
jgi:ATPase family associated with various cellular activities (AAA)